MDPEASKQLEGRVRAALNQHNVANEGSVGFFLFVLRSCGLDCAPQPELKTTARALGRRASDASERQRREILAGEFQTTHGERVIPIGPHRGRRPDPEIVDAVKLFYVHLHYTLRMRAARCWGCIAALLNAVGGLGTQSADTVRRRLERGERLWRADYVKALWRSGPEGAKGGLASFPTKVKDRW